MGEAFGRAAANAAQMGVELTVDSYTMGLGGAVVSNVIKQHNGMSMRIVEDEGKGKDMVEQQSRSAGLWSPSKRNFLHFKQPVWSWTDSRGQLESFAKENCGK